MNRVTGWVFSEPQLEEAIKQAGEQGMFNLTVVSAFLNSEHMKKHRISMPAGAPELDRARVAP